ncbi:MAG: hypothetical protein GY859_16835, partial [Desulfobacterales bacterium]|nr:hypothetical protein [Desulfobacterales bacterium]
EFGAMPDIDASTNTFDSGAAWSMSQEGDDYRLTLHPLAFKHPLWIAKINRNFTRATVYCGDRLTTKKKGRIFISHPVRYPLDQILLMYMLARARGAIFHAAGVQINGRGFLFPGKSGAGKSTITRQFAAWKDIGLFSDDRVAVREIDGRFKCFGTPWPGEAGIAENVSAPLSGIFFIHHGSANRIRRIEPREATEKILPVASIPWFDRRIMPKLLDFCGDLITRVPTYELRFKPDLEVVDVFKDFISNEKIAASFNSHLA